MSLPVTTARFFEPEIDRQEMTVAENTRLDLIVAMALPNASDDELSRARVALVTQNGQTLVHPSLWRVVRPRAGVHIVIRVAPAKDSLRSILQILVTVAAIALGQLWVAPLFGTLAGSIASAAFTAIGNLLINALIPPVNPNKDKERPTFSISGFRNQYSPDGAVPAVLGKHRFAPPFAAMSWTEIVGDLQYVRALFCAGYGEVEISDLKIGDTPFSSYDEIEFETRAGLPTDLPLTLFREQVLEEQLGALLQRPLPRNDYGDVIGGAGIDSPVSRFTAADAQRFGLIIAFPAGLLIMDNKGRKQGFSVTLFIRYRLNGLGLWTSLPGVAISALKEEAFYRQLIYDLPTRGRYEVEVNRVSDEVDNSAVSERVVWAALQSYRPEYPLNFDRPLALIAVRVKATYQLNGALDNVNALCQRVCLDWDSATQMWIKRATSNPAALYRFVLQSGVAQFPAADDELDLNALASWAEYCEDKGLKYDRVHDFVSDLYDTLSQVAAAGRASPHHDGVKWSVVIDRPQTLVIDHLSPRNSRDFRWSRTYFNPPHAFRVSFLDADNDYQSAERLVPSPDHTGPITITEKLELPGKTDATEVYREAVRRWYELQYRPDRFTVLQDGAARTATRGDLVMASFDTLDETQFAARVKSVRPPIGGMPALVELDDWIDGDGTIGYGCRFMSISGGIGYEATEVSIVMPCLVGNGMVNVIQIAGETLPQDGDLIQIGPLNSESLPLIVNRIEPSENYVSHLTLVAAAPEIDAAVDAAIVPAWIGRVGTDIGSSGLAPATPVFLRISSGVSSAGNSNSIIVLISPGPGSAAPVLKFEVRHRLVGSPTWTTTNFMAAEGGGTITTYAVGNNVQINARAVAIDATPGAYTAISTIVVGSGDAAAPAALTTPSIAGGLGGAMASFGVSANTNEVRLYRQAGTGGVLNEAADIKFSYAVQSGTTYQTMDGDGSRVNLFTNADFAVGTGWTLDAGWSIASGKAAKAAGTAGFVHQAPPLAIPATFRAQMVVSGRSAGTIRIGLKGSTNVLGAARNANGTYLETLVSVAGITGAGAYADAAFVGSVDDLILYEQTAICLPQGTHTWWLRPFNDGIPGPLSGPFTATII